MASVKLVLVKHKKKKNNTIPIAVRLIKDRKPSYIFTGEAILEKDWDANQSKAKKSYLNSTRLNSFLLKKLSEAHAKVLESEVENENLSTKQIKKKVKRPKNKASFFHFAIEERIKPKYIAGTFSVAKSELSILYNIEEFLNHNPREPIEKINDEITLRRKKRISKARKGEHTTKDDLEYFSKKNSLSFSDIDTAFINRYKSFCSTYLNHKTRTVTNQLIFIRTLFNLAIKENVITSKNYPFAGDNEKIRIGSSNKIGLNKDEIIEIENLELEKGTSIWHTKNVFLFSYYFAGVRISDVLELRWSDIIDGRLYYEMNKNEKPVSLKVPQQALIILALYEASITSPTDFIFPFLKKANLSNKEDVFTKIRNATKLFNKYLKLIAIMCNIEKNLSNHISRHSFGNIAGDKIDPRMLQKLYRHSDLKTTLGYQANFIHKDADDALEQVLNS